MKAENPCRGLGKKLPNHQGNSHNPQTSDRVREVCKAFHADLATNMKGSLMIPVDNHWNGRALQTCKFPQRTIHQAKWCRNYMHKIYINEAYVAFKNPGWLCNSKMLMDYSPWKSAWPSCSNTQPEQLLQLREVLIKMYNIRKTTVYCITFF